MLILTPEPMQCTCFVEYSAILRNGSRCWWLQRCRESQFPKNKSTFRKRITHVTQFGKTFAIPTSRTRSLVVTDVSEAASRQHIHVCADEERSNMPHAARVLLQGELVDCWDTINALSCRESCKAPAPNEEPRSQTDLRLGNLEDGCWRCVPERYLARYSRTGEHPDRATSITDLSQHMLTLPLPCILM
jgi:hypothetical protein